MDNTHQFDNKSKIYNQARPKYAAALLKYIDDNLVPRGKVKVADVGAGTGIFTAQAFHWFDPVAFKKECQRILKPQGYVVIVYNSRFKDANTVQLIKILRKYCPRFHGFSNHYKEKDFMAFFNNQCQIKKFANPQYCDRDKYVARVLSSSYSLSKNDVHYLDYVRELNILGERVCKNGAIKTPIITTAYIGRV